MSESLKQFIAKKNAENTIPKMTNSDVEKNKSNVRFEIISDNVQIIRSEDDIEDTNDDGVRLYLKFKKVCAQPENLMNLEQPKEYEIIPVRFMTKEEKVIPGKTIEFICERADETKFTDEELAKNESIQEIRREANAGRVKNFVIEPVGSYFMKLLS